MQARTMLRVGAALGALAVALGAFGAHAIDWQAAGHDSDLWDLGARYQMYHALALVLAGLLADRGYRCRTAAWCFTAGTLIFAGTLYALALDAPRWLGAITPIGGVSLIAGWLALLTTRT